jgi:Xaa-Pro dipeptidase
MTRNIMVTKPIANPDLPSPPSGKYPAKDHARRVAKWIKENGGPESGLIYLEGQSLHMVEVSQSPEILSCPDGAEVDQSLEQDDDQAKHFR